jgi:DUF4097 and DUF4098 domain-containing protein YvlB
VIYKILSFRAHNPMNIRFRAPQIKPQGKRAWLSILIVVCLVLGASAVSAQQKVSKRFPVGKNVRLELRNWAGTVTVESWDRDEIRISASLESPAAHFNPQQTESGVVIDLVSDNRGRVDVGDVTFRIQVPVRSSVDIETRRGQISISNIQGDLVRAHVWTSGDIQLLGVNASRVFASNTMGDVFFDGDFLSGGTYEFKSGQGNITLRLSPNCGFRLIATDHAKKISMGPFMNENMKLTGEGRRMIGDVGDGRASVTITNYQGSIKFMHR